MTNHKPSFNQLCIASGKKGKRTSKWLRHPFSSFTALSRTSLLLLKWWFNTLADTASPHLPKVMRSLIVCICGLLIWNKLNSHTNCNYLIQSAWAIKIKMVMIRTSLTIPSIATNRIAFCPKYTGEECSCWSFSFCSSNMNSLKCHLETLRTKDYH